MTTVEDSVYDTNLSLSKLNHQMGGSSVVWEEGYVDRSMVNCNLLFGNRPIYDAYYKLNHMNERVTRQPQPVRLRKE